MVPMFVMIGIPICIVGIMLFLYFQLKSLSNKMDALSPATVARLLDYLDTLQPYLLIEKLNQHDWGYASTIVSRILDVDDGDLQFLSSEEERILSDFVYGNKKMNVPFKHACRDIWHRIKKLSSRLDEPVTGYGYPASE